MHPQLVNFGAVVRTDKPTNGPRQKIMTSSAHHIPW